MFGVNSAAHAASRSAKTSPGAARNSAIVCPSSISSALHRRNARIRSPINSLTPTICKHPDEMGLDCVETRAGQEPELGDFLAPPVIARPALPDRRRMHDGVAGCRAIGIWLIRNARLRLQFLGERDRSQCQSRRNAFEQPRQRPRDLQESTHRRCARRSGRDCAVVRLLQSVKLKAIVSGLSGSYRLSASLPPIFIDQWMRFASCGAR